MTIQKGTLSLTVKVQVPTREAGWIGRSAKTVMCPRAARVHRTSSQAPRSHHIVIEILDLLLVGRSGWAPGVRMHDSMTGSMIGSSPVPLATLCALCVPLRRTAESACAALRRSAPLQYRTARRSARRCAAPGRSAPLHPSLLDEHRCAT